VDATVKLWRIRRDLYRGARLLGDLQAIEKGPTAVPKRLERRWLWRVMGKLLRRMT
jgi:hypothetical protein